MKKFLAVLLIFALMLPLGISANAAEAETKPFYLVNWSDVGENEEYTNVYPMMYLWSNKSKFTKENVHISCPSLGGEDPKTIAENIKQLFDTYPKGARYINFSPMGTALFLHQEVCFIDGLIPQVKTWMEEFMSHYASIGGKLDGLIVDIEFLDIWASYIENRYNDDPLVYDWIVKHPTYQEKIRPQLVERGFKFYPNPTEHTPEIYGIHSKSGSEYAQSRSIWNAVMRNYVNDVITEAASPMWKYYPDALMADYRIKDSKPWNEDLVSGSAGGNYETNGNMSNENFYMIRPSTTFNSDGEYGTIIGYNSAVFEITAFNRFLYDNNIARTTCLSSDNGNISWWIAGHHYGAKGEGSLCDSPYYAESLIHMGMLNPQVYLGYILQQDALNDSRNDWVLSLHIVDDILKELTRVVGGADREAIWVEPAWNNSYVLSGMHVNGKNIWRLTPDTDQVSLEDFKVAGDDLTFRVKGQTITFPGGKIIKDGNVREIGTCGYWIETAENVNPVITRSEEYFRNYAGYREDYEAFQLGTEYNYNNALPAASWEIKVNKKDNSSSTVIADPTNADKKVLELKGTVNLRNVKMPENISAGDTYAKNQAWEVSVTLPSDMAADAEVVVLNAANEKRLSKDGGFKITGGKVYYSKDSEYVEMEGVTLSAGVEYTFIREMNFTDPKNFTSDYYVYATDGTLVGKAKKVPIEELVLPIYSISLACSKVSGGAVLMDDYKLYPTKVTADLYLYHADTGMEIAETDRAQEGNVAYRLSWLNATDKEKSYSVVAAYYNGDTLVSETVVQDVKMARDMNGVITGVVKNESEGQTLKVYLKDNNPAEPEENEEKPPVVGDDQNKTDDTGLDSKLIIIIAAAAAVMVIAVVVIVIVASAKKKKKLAAEPAENPQEISENEETTEE